MLPQTFPARQPGAQQPSPHCVVGRVCLSKETNKTRAGKAASSEAAVIRHVGLRSDLKKRKGATSGASSLPLSVVLKYSNMYSLFFPPQR